MLLFRLKAFFFGIKYYIIALYQKVIRDFSDDVTWNLDITISRFVLPRLKRFKELAIGCPGNFANMDEWNKAIDDMIFAFECNLKKFDTQKSFTKKDIIRINRGLRLFAKHYYDLWW